VADRILVAKVGLDGHDRGVKVVARILRDAGFEVIYTGLFQTPDTVAAAAVDEDVDAIGLSMLSGAHMTLAPKVVEKVRARGSDIPVVVGGIIPEPDVAQLTALGVAAVLTPGATADEVVRVVQEAIERSRTAVASDRTDGNTGP
jgi:methylmalonyl-CoA mutase C-terminal domain/subunit